MMRSFVRSIKKGMIQLWSGAVVDIPGGWVLCNGANGTPDLTNQFIIGAGDAYAVAATGGSHTHIHTGSTNGHYHTFDESGFYRGSGSGQSDYTQSQIDTFTTDLGANKPPYYALAYIMKL